MVYFLLAFFASIPIFLPASHQFSVLVLRVIFGIGTISYWGAAFRSNLHVCLGMVSFRKLTILQLGGEERLLKMDNVEVGRRPVCLIYVDLAEVLCLENFYVQVKLGSLPFCCLAPFSCTMLPLKKRSLHMVTQLIYQVPYSQFAILYITMR